MLQRPLHDARYKFVTLPDDVGFLWKMNLLVKEDIRYEINVTFDRQRYDLKLPTKKSAGKPEKPKKSP